MKTKQVNVVVGVDLSNPNIVYMGNDPELGEVELIVATDSPEEKERKEKEAEEKIKEIEPTIDNEDK